MTILKEAIPFFDMLKDVNRQELLMLLFDKGEQTVNQLTENISLSRPTVSHHLKLLLQAGLVNVRQEGKERYYSIDLRIALENLKRLVSSIENDMKES
ncbi:ArsR/SmtB family transcription factor [Streptococcus oricebi]|nr:metalloregulator ArsR/SmtB family transcription factor [Streptococcus oricebi]